MKIQIPIIKLQRYLYRSETKVKRNRKHIELYENMFSQLTDRFYVDAHLSDCEDRQAMTHFVTLGKNKNSHIKLINH